MPEEPNNDATNSNPDPDAAAIAAAAAQATPPAAATPVVDPNANPTTPATPAASDGATDGDWRDKLASNVPSDVQRKFRKSLDQYPGLQDVGNVLVDLRKQADGRMKVPDAEAREEDHKAFAKTLGWPDEVKDGESVVKSYGYERPDGAAELFDEETHADDSENMLFASAQADMVPPQYAKWAMDKYYQVLEESTAARIESAEKAAADTTAFLEKEWGAEKAENMKHANEFIKRYAGDESLDILNIELKDGRQIGDLPSIVQALAAGGRATSEAQMAGDTVTGDRLTSVETEIAAFKERERKGETLTEQERERKTELYGLKYGHAPADGRA